MQHKFTLWFDLVCPETWHHSHPQNNCCPHATGVWLAWRRGIYPRGQENKSELFLVALIKILVFGQENFLAQFLILHCTIGLPRWIRGGIKPNKHTQHPPKKPKSSHSKANTQEGLWAQPVHELRLIKQPKTERDDPNVSPASPAQPGGRTVLLLPVMEVDLIRSILQNHQLIKTTAETQPSFSRAVHRENPSSLHPHCLSSLLLLGN